MNFQIVKMHKDKVSTKIQKYLLIRIIATGPCIANQLRDINTICRRSWYIAAHIWKIYDYTIEVILFIINFTSSPTCIDILLSRNHFSPLKRFPPNTDNSFWYTEKQAYKTGTAKQDIKKKYVNASRRTCIEWT
jgi:hypothetical protein